MRFTLPNELTKAKDYLDSLAGVIEVIKKHPPRSLKQNAYLHVCITVFAIEVGMTLEEAKQYLKSRCGFMTYERSMKIEDYDIIFYKSTAGMNSKELTDFIEWIRNYAGTHGINIESPEYYLRNWDEYEKYVERNKTYL